MTDDDIKRLKRLAEQATPGPWRVNMKGHSYHEVARVNDLEIAPPNSVDLSHWTVDAAYIAAASPDVVLALLGEVDKLRAASRAVTQCRCTLVQQSVGDGCEVCNPQLAQRLADEAQAGVPEGWKLVPVEPTPEMLATTSWPGCAATDYAHMLAAAPQPPSAQPTLTAEIVERRLRTWRQRFVNRSGDQLALDDFLDRESLDDLVDFVCDEYSKEAKR